MMRIKAFTLFEMVLAMLLAAIVIGMAYSAYTIIISMYKNHSVYVERNTTIATFRKVVYADFDEATDVALNGNRIIFKDINHETTTSYEINRDSVIRISKTIDTFYLKELVVAAEFENKNTMQGRIDHLTFNFRHAGIPVTLGINKVYSSEELFDTKTD